MSKIPLARADRSRRVTAESDVLLRNRFIEPNPVLADGYCYVQRPGLARFVDLGEGPVRGLFHQPGTFGDDHFTAHADTLTRVSRYGVKTVISTALFGADFGSNVSMCCTGDVGTIPPFLWLADGQYLWVYTEDGWASGTLTATANAANTETVRVDGVYYKFVNTSVDAGTPAGTAGSPWLVKLGVNAAESLSNLFHAINDSDTGAVGTTYSTALTAHTTAIAASATSDHMIVRSADFGTAGNSIILAETVANMSWSGATMSGGGSPAMVPVALPADYAPVSVGFINGYVIVVPAKNQGVNGRFYWVAPGETFVDSLNYATAERSADPCFQVIVFGDQFWLPGQNTTEAWFMSGDPDAPVQRVQGVLFERGTIPGTAVQVKDSMVIADNDGGVFRVQGGPQRISTPDIEERIRKAVARQNFINP
jgi:hypothetical protein